MKILITGATGFVGRRLVKRLLDDNNEITCLVRSIENAKKIIPQQVRFICGDLDGLTCLQQIKNSIDVVCHLAGCIDSNLKKDFYEINAGGTKNLMTAFAGSTSLKKFFYLSSLAVLGRNYRMPLTEDLACRPFSPYGRSKLEAEESLLNNRELSIDTKIFILRTPIIYGEEQPQVMNDFFKKIKKNQALLIGSGRNVRSLCYVGNLVDAISHLVKNNILTKRTYIFHVADDESYTLKQLMQLIGEIAGVKQLVIKNMPDFFSWFALLFFKLLAFFGINSFKLFAIATASANINCSIEKIKKETSFRPQYSTKQGLTRTIAWMKEKLLL